MKSDVLVLALNRFDYKNKEGNQMRGAEITFTTGRTQTSSGNNQRFGLEISTLRCPFELGASLRDVPGIYEATFEPYPGRDSFGNDTMLLRVVGLAFLRPATLGGLDGGSAAASNGVSPDPARVGSPK